MTISSNGESMQLFHILFNLIFIVGFTGPLFAELKYNPTTYRYYSLPATPNINQDAYHNLVWQCKDLKQQHQAMVASSGGSGISSFAIHGAQQMIRDHLQRIATPTSIRLLDDLKAINFDLYSINSRV